MTNICIAHDCKSVISREREREREREGERERMPAGGEEQIGV